MSTAVAFQAYGGFPGSGGKAKDGEVLQLGNKKLSDGFFIEEEEAEEVLQLGNKKLSDGFFIEEEEAEEVLTDSSSIGAPSLSSSSIGEDSSSEAGEEGEEEEVESKLKEEPGLGCLEALEDSLPIKNGLSSFYAGKSKSFTSLAEAAAREAVKELAKPENPFNKRRRILATWSRRASCSSLATATYLPPLLAPDHALHEGDEGEEDDSDGSDSDEQPQQGHRGKNAPALALPPPMLSLQTQTGGPAPARRSGSFRSPRSYSLSDLRNSGGAVASYNNNQ